MIEVAPHLFVGNQLDWEKHVKDKDGTPKTGWSVVHACKEPYHREAVGYQGRGCDPKHPEYLLAVRGERMCLNMVDVEKPEYFREEMIDAALGFIKARIDAGRNVLIHCNQGGSRAPSLALLYLRRHAERFEALNFEDAEYVFQAIYPAYMPAKGIRGYLEAHW